MRYLLFSIGALFLFSAASKSWTPEQIRQAHTAKSTSFADDMEKEAILYLNLARLYPSQFWDYELQDYTGRATLGRSNPKPYIRSLRQTLKRMDAVPAFKPDSALYETAKCFVLEQGKTNRTGHKRYKCENDYRGECISYGMYTGSDIILQLLYDVDIKNLGHRKLCLREDLTLLGLSSGEHKYYKTMAVLNFK